MRIIDDHPDRYTWKHLGLCAPGTVVKFNVVFNSKYAAHDLFIVNAVCSSYQPFHGRQAASKVPVTCLRTGDLAYAKDDRHVRPIECAVHIEED